ncbi:MAG TPA: zinc ribbon domain-containing protein [Candidatus Paceibacterota bacterium]|nr:zinc ribbon domain-containing protein [Verrucomicrobiota bacterium]HRY47482.1 zinc ribbon domain-containing protein [Candidatus Paceibacterota bacterium]HSA00007.1 zinc ribbon domain-containing protein [Candidatus Paceibacterota bacterium]
MKKCPYCAEAIQDEAIKCRFCGEPLVPPVIEQRRSPWYYSDIGIFILFLCVGPFVLPLVWWNPRYPLPIKIGITVLILILTWLMILSLSASLAKLTELYRMLQNPEIMP